MKRPKFLLKIDTNNRAKVYVGGKWHPYISELHIEAKPQNISVCFTEYKKNKKGVFYTIGNEIASETKTYFFGNEYIKPIVKLDKK